MFNRREMNEICCHHHPDAQLIEDYHAGDMICSECGLVVGDRVIDVGSEWRTFSNNDKTTEDPSRVGGPENPLLNGNDLSTIIGPARGDASFDESGMAKYHNRKTMSSSDITLMNAFREIASMSDKINLSKSIVDRANALFKQVYDKKMKGSNNGLATACLYIACRLEHVPRTFKEICAVSKVNKTNIAKFYRKIKNEFEMRLDLISAEDFMPRFCTKLGLPNTVQRVATHIAKEAVDIDIVIGKSPISVAAAAIYMASQASGEFKKQVKEIGDVAGTAESTIQTSYKEMLPHAACLFPNTFKSPIPIEQLLPKS